MLIYPKNRNMFSNLRIEIFFYPKYRNIFSNLRIEIFFYPKNGMFFYPQENRMQKCTYSIDNMIYMYKSTSGPLISDTFSCLYRGQPFYVLKITFTVYHKSLGIPVLVLILVMSSAY